MPFVWDPDLLSMPEQVQKNKDDIEYLKQHALIHFKGVYDAATTYKVNDVVYYTDTQAVYVHTDEAETVGVPPTDTTVWTFVIYNIAR